MYLKVLVDFENGKEAMSENTIGLASASAPKRGDGAASAAILMN